MSVPVQIFHDSQGIMAAVLAQSIADDLRRAVRQQGKALLVLPGGSSPRGLIRELAHQSLPWEKITVTTTDERYVPFESGESNAGQIKKLSGIEPVWLADENAAIGDLGWPSTVTVLGMGTDAHIASLFPGAEIDMEAEGIVKATAPAEPRERISLGMKTLLSAQRLILLVTGDEKRALCERILKGDQQDTPLAQLIALAGDRLALHFAES